MRININVELDKKTTEWVRKMNKRLSSITEQEIDFEKMPIRPHLTLLLCEIHEEDLAKITNIINDSRFLCELQTAEFLPPVIKGNYIMMPVKNTEKFLHDYEKLNVLLRELVVPGAHKMTADNPPHITLGYTTHPGKVRSFVKAIVPPPPARLDQIVISRAAKHGVVFEGEY